MKTAGAGQINSLVSIETVQLQVVRTYFQAALLLRTLLHVCKCTAVTNSSFKKPYNNYGLNDLIQIL